MLRLYCGFVGVTLGLYRGYIGVLLGVFKVFGLGVQGLGNGSLAYFEDQALDPEMKAGYNQGPLFLPKIRVQGLGFRA